MDAVWLVMEDEPSGRMMGMGLQRWRGMKEECCLTNEEEMTLPSAPLSIRI